MKNVFVIADLSHATPRIPGIVKYLGEFGWRATIVTGNLPEKPLPETEIIRTPFPDALVSWKKFLRLNPEKGFQQQLGIPLQMRENRRSFSHIVTTSLKGLIAYPDTHRKWKSFALLAAEKVFQAGNVDVIFSSSSPVTAHLIARDLKKRFRKPWVADLRDLWTQNHNYPYGRTRKLLEKRLELATLAEADELVTVSPLWAEDLRRLHRRDRVHCITNGFDPAETNLRPDRLTEKFTVTYTGPIYTRKHDTAVFLSALHDLISGGKIDSDRIEIRFYGPPNELLGTEISGFHLSGVVTQNGLVPRRVSFEKQRESHVLLLFNWNDPKVKGWYPLKTFEYLAARRPILSVGGYGDDVVKNLLEETRGGAYCRTPEEIRDFLRRAYSEFIRAGSVAYAGDPDKINQYSHREMAEKFSLIFNQLAGNRDYEP